jgi:hypothetical protein
MKKNLKKVLLWTTIIIVLAGSTLGIFLFKIMDSDCGATVLEKFPSPSGKTVAVVYNYDCGATTGFSTQVDLLKPNEEAKGLGNLFRVYEERGKSVETYIGGGPKIQLMWDSDQKITIHYPANALIRKKVEKLKGVIVDYIEQ